MSAWVQRLALQHDATQAGKARSDRFLARMSGLPARDELRRLAGDLASRIAWDDLVLTLPVYNPLWKGNIFQADRLALLASRAPYLLTPERWGEWRAALSVATNNREIGPAWVALDVLDTDLLFSPGGYREAVGAQLLGRLKNVPPDSIAAVAETVGLAPGQAAMYIVSADWAFRGTEFRAPTFAQALATLRKSVPPPK